MAFVKLMNNGNDLPTRTSNLMINRKLLNVTIIGKIDHLRTSTEFHFLPVHKSYIHALFRNTKH